MDGYYGKFNWKNLLTDLEWAYHNDPLGQIVNIHDACALRLYEDLRGCNRSCSLRYPHHLTGSTSPVRWEDLV